MKPIIITVIAIVEFYTLQMWFSCKNFAGLLHASSVNIPLQLESLIYAEKGTPILLTRVFNNKVTVTFIEYFQLYLRYWDIRFGSNWFSLVGYFGILAGLYYILTNKKKKIYHWLMLVGILILPCIEIFLEPRVPMIVKSLYLWLPYCLFSLYGISQFLTHGNIKKRMVVIVLLIALSFWWLIFVNYGIKTYCIR